MSRVLTFARQYPSYHPRRGESTYFVEKIWQSIGLPGHEYTRRFEKIPGDFKSSIAWDYRMPDGPKHHTIRSGHRWKAGDWFRPRVWSGKPYNSKQIQFAPDIQVKKTWDFWGSGEYHLNSKTCSLDLMRQIVVNDGLSYEDFLNWFQWPKPFDGQIICWSDQIEY